MYELCTSTATNVGPNISNKVYLRETVQQQPYILQQLDMCHFLCSSNREVSLTIESQIKENSKFEKLLGIRLDSKLNFNFIYMTFVKKHDRKGINAFFY